VNVLRKGACWWRFINSHRKYLPVLLAIVFLFSGVSQSQTRETITGGAFSLQLPPGWFADRSGEGGFAGAYGVDNDSHTSVIVRIIVSHMTLADRVAQINAQGHAPDFLTREADLQLGGVPAHAFVIGPQPGKPDKELVVAVADGKEYDIVLLSTVERFAGYEDVFGRMLQSIAWRKAADRTYRTSDGALALAVPPNFIVVEGGDNGLKFVLLGPRDDPFSPSIAVSAAELGSESFSQYVTRESSSKESEIAATEIEDRQYLLFKGLMGPATGDQARTVGGHEGRELHFREQGVSAPSPAEHDPLDLSVPPEIKVTVEEVLVKIGNTVWTFRFNAAKDAEQYRKIFNTVLGSVHWKSS
jgi:hypothetical protein